MTALPARFWAKVDRSAGPGGCWPWTGHRNEKGYGRCHIDGRGQRAHRAVYLRFVGPIPADMCLDHLCRNRACVNPDHLQPVTSRENTMRGVGLAVANVAKTHCPRGHEFTPENTYRAPGRPTSRNCRACQRARRTQAVAA